MNARAIVITVGVALMSAASAAAGEGSGALKTRVRVLAPTLSEKPIVGELVASDETTLMVRRAKGRLWNPGWPFSGGDGESVLVPRKAVTLIERSVRPSRKPLGALVGGLIGLGAALVVIEKSREGEDTGCGGCGVFLAVGAGSFALLGAAVAPGDRWAAENVATVHVGFTPARGGGVGVRLAVTF